MERFFKVAGFTFAVQMDDSHGLWALMANYRPFEVPQQGQGVVNLADVNRGDFNRSEGLLFRLKVEGVMELPAEEPYYKEEPERTDMPRVTVYKSAQGLSFSMKPTSSQPDAFLLEMSTDFSSGTLRLRADGQFQKFALDNSLMLLFTMSTTGKDTLAMHASVIKLDEMGYLFLGESGTGKSTHSRMWLENIPGSELLNDDNPVVRIMPGGQAWVFGTPWSGKTPCYKNDQVTVGGVVLIRRCKHNELSRLPFFEAYPALLMSCSGLKFSEKSMDELTDTQSKLLSSVPFYVMDCLPDADAARVCYKGLTNGK